MDIESVKERIEMLMELGNDSMSGFAKKIGIDPSGFNRKMKGETVITPKDIHKICIAFGVNKEWLCDGTGEMYDKNVAPQTFVRQSNNHINGNAWCINGDSAVLQKEIEMLRTENERLHEEIDWLRSLVEQKLK